MTDDVHPIKGMMSALPRPVNLSFIGGGSTACSWNGARGGRRWLGQGKEDAWGTRKRVVWLG